jgi:hypothetical protein
MFHIKASILLKFNTDANCYESTTYKQTPGWLAAPRHRSLMRRGEAAAAAAVFRQSRQRLRGQHINSY